MDRLSELDVVLAALRTSSGLHRFGDPAGEDEIVRAEVRLGRPLPLTLERFVRATNGGDFFDGNLRVRPLFLGFDDGMLDLADDLRNDGWVIADDLIVLGTDGSGDPFGLYYPRSATPSGRVPVVEIGSISSAANMALGGTDLGRYLRAVSAYYLVLLNGPTDALDVLEVPDQLRNGPGRSFAPYIAWADPQLPDPRADPYAARLDIAAVEAVLGALRS